MAAPALAVFEAVPFGVARQFAVVPRIAVERSFEGAELLPVAVPSVMAAAMVVAIVIPTIKTAAAATLVVDMVAESIVAAPPWSEVAPQ